MDFALLEFAVGIGVTLVTVIIKDAVLKNTIKHQIQEIKTLLSIRVSQDEAQDARIAKLDAELARTREELLLMREKQTALRERVDTMQREEIRTISETLQEVKQSYASLDATLKGLQGWLTNVAKKLDRVAEA